MKIKSLIRGVGILITAFLFIALICLLFSMLISQIVPSVQGLMMNSDSYVDNVISWINQTLENTGQIFKTVGRMAERYYTQYGGAHSHRFHQCNECIGCIVEFYHRIYYFHLCISQ